MLSSVRWSLVAGSKTENEAMIGGDTRCDYHTIGEGGVPDLEIDNLMKKSRTSFEQRKETRSSLIGHMCVWMTAFSQLTACSISLSVIDHAQSNCMSHSSNVGHFQCFLSLREVRISSKKLSFRTSLWKNGIVVKQLGLYNLVLTCCAVSLLSLFTSLLTNTELRRWVIFGQLAFSCAGEMTFPIVLVHFELCYWEDFLSADLSLSVCHS